jgi:nitrogen fixation protein FixH
MSWGYKILIVYIVFVGAMLSMVYVASRQTNEMQDDNYYAKELVYQSVIDGKNNLNALPEKLTVENTTDAVQIKLPASTATNITDGTVYFLRPSNEKIDLKEALTVDANGIQKIAKSKFTKGLYSLKISWKSNGTVYFHEQKFNVE